MVWYRQAAAALLILQEENEVWGLHPNKNSTDKMKLTHAVLFTGLTWLTSFSNATDNASFYDGAAQDATAFAIQVHAESQTCHWTHTNEPPSMHIPSLNGNKLWQTSSMLLINRMSCGRTVRFPDPKTALLLAPMQTRCISGWSLTCPTRTLSWPFQTSLTEGTGYGLSTTCKFLRML
jgi:hypothetical protein